jgi:hypothetical protein
MSTSISSLASSLPGHACTPLPNGVKVLGRGATCVISTHTTREEEIQYKRTRFYYLLLKKKLRIHVSSFEATSIVNNIIQKLLYTVGSSTELSMLTYEKEI